MKIVLDTNCLVSVIMPGSNIERVYPTYRFNLITADPDDNKFVDCAVIAAATCIVSNDRHFRELEQHPFPRVDVRSLAQFKTMLDS